jgi:hypothetical protein
MPAKELYVGCSVGEKTMRITVLGAITLIAAAIVAGFLLRALQAKSVGKII